MAIVTTDDKHYRDIASAIRSSADIDTTFKPEEMAYGVGLVFDAGRKDGMYVGMVDEQSRFWGAYQQNGNRTDYSYAFSGAAWNADCFEPKHDIKIYAGTSAFRYSTMGGSLKELLEKQGVKLVFMYGYSITNMFSGTNFEEIGVIDLSAGTHRGGTYVFNGNSNLHTIEKIIFSESMAGDFTGWFNDDTALENLIAEGTIAKNNFNVQWSPLTKASITSIINALSTTTSGLSITLSKTAVETAFGSTNTTEWTSLIGTKPNWTINLA